MSEVTSSDYGVYLISYTNNGVHRALNSPLLKVRSSSYSYMVYGVFYSAPKCLFATQAERTDPCTNSLRTASRDFLSKEAKVYGSLF